MSRSTISRPSLRGGARLSSLAAAAVVAVMAFAGPVAARVRVDPGTLNPPPPDFFNAVCELIGRGTVCTLGFSDPPIVNDASGIICGATELLFSQTRSVVGKRFYDANGNLTQRHFREDLAGAFTNPVTGRVAPWNQHDTVIHDLAVPGDLSTGTMSMTGLITRSWLPGGGTVLVDAGRLLLDPATGAVIGESGQHPIEDYFAGTNPSALAGLCAALA